MFIASCHVHFKDKYIAIGHLQLHIQNLERVIGTIWTENVHMQKCLVWMYET